MFESIFINMTDGTINIGPAMLSLLVAAVLGLIIGMAYIVVYKKEGYSKNFIVGLVLLPAIVSVVILLIGSNVARAFSMAGAFALVRFRSAPGNAKDIAIVFLSMAAGLACGLGYLTFAGIFVIVMVLILVVLSLVGFADKQNEYRQLKITIPENLNYTHAFDEVFHDFLEDIQLRKVKTTNMGTLFELTYWIKFRNDSDEKEFIDSIRVKNGNLNILLDMPEMESSVLN